MASSARPTEDPLIAVKQEDQTGDSFITLKRQHQTGDSFISLKQQHQTGDSFITVKQEHETEDSIITVKHEHQTGDSYITVKKQQHPTRDSFITVKVVDQVNLMYDFRIKRDEPLQRLVNQWKDWKGMADYERVKLIFNGRMIDADNKTANDIGLKDGDSIVAMRVQIGD